ncbi:MAG: hypothetical protein UC451_06955 [Faecalibacterium sp.]|nr:hypothetical protein [Faecalibacterium sp.]
MTNKKFKLAAMSLATAVAVSAVGPSASAVTYYLGNGSVTVDQDKDGNGAYSYQGEDGPRTYVNVEKAETGDGTIYVMDGKAPTEVPPTTDNSDNGTEVPTPTDNATQSTDASGNNEENNTTTETTTPNTITVKEDVKDATIVVEGVNVDTSTPTEVPTDAQKDKTIIKVGEGADVDLTVRDSNLTTGGHGIDIGVNLEGKDDNKGANVDLTLDNTQINLTQNGKAGINVQDNSDVDLTLKGENAIDGSKAIENEKESILTSSVNVEGIRVGDGGASDGSGTSEGANTKLTISGGVEKTETAETDTEETESSAGGSLTISDTTGGLVMADGSDVEITDGADVTIKDTKTSGATQAGRAVTQHGDLTISGGSSLKIDDVEDNAKQAPHTGIGIASWDDITVEDGSTLDISDATTGIYGHQGSDASLTVEDSTLNISDVSRGIDYEGKNVDEGIESAGDISFKDSSVTISAEGAGAIITGDNGNSSLTFDHTEANLNATKGKAIYAGDKVGSDGNLTITNGSKLNIEADRGIWAGYKEVTIDNSTVNSKTVAQGFYALGRKNTENKHGVTLHITNGGKYNLYGGGDQNWAVDANSSRGNRIIVDGNGTLLVDQNDSNAGIAVGKNGELLVENGTVLVKGNYVDSMVGDILCKGTGILAYGSNSSILIKDNAHVESTSVTRFPGRFNQNLIVTGGTLTYDYSADNTLWPVNEQGDKLTNFLLTKDDVHANFDALSYNGQTYTYLSDLNKETGKQYLSVWVPAAALNYMLDVDGSHDPEIIGKALEELKQAGYNFNTAYQTAENGDQVVILRDMVVNGKSLNFTKTTDAEGNTKLIWGNYEKQAEGAPSAYDMVYGTEYEYEGKTYTIVWGYESQNNPNTTAAAGVLDAFGPDSNVKVTGDIDGTDSAKYTVTIYGALREVTDPVIPTNPKPVTPEDSAPTPPAPTTPTTPAVQDARPTTPAVEQAVAKTTPAPETPVNPPVQDARPESGKLIQTGTTNWMADVLVRAGGVLLAAGYLLERKRKSMFHKAQH